MWRSSALWEVAEVVPTRQEMERALVERQGADLTARFSAATVAVCGLGGLGSHIACFLARAGVGRLLLIDFDQVDVTNLHRQQYKASQVGRYKTEALAENLREAAPYIHLTAHTRRLTAENIPQLLGEADIICEALDDPAVKAMLVNTVLEKLPGAYLVAASGMAGLGSANAIRTRRLTSRFYLCGDGVSDVEEGMGLVASRVALCAAQQAHMVLRILSGESEP